MLDIPALPISRDRLFQVALEDSPVRDFGIAIIAVRIEPPVSSLGLHPVRAGLGLHL
jgi:hypothetical protein